MAKFTFTKEKIVASGEKIGMILQKHTIDEVPPEDKELLMVINIGTKDGCLHLWTVGSWTKNDWICPYDDIGYTVVEWYALPILQEKIIKIRKN